MSIAILREQMKGTQDSLMGPGDTIPFEDMPNSYQPRHTFSSSPATVSVLKPHGDHLHLIPINLESRVAFNEIAEIIKKYPDRLPRQRHFVHINEAQEPLTGHADSSTDSAPEHETEPTPVWAGYFRLNLDFLPQQFWLGTTFGSGKPMIDDPPVDVVLTLNRRRDRVRSTHMRYVYHAESYVSMLKAFPRKTIVLNGEKVDDQGVVLPGKVMSLTVGRLQYRLDHSLAQKPEHRSRLAKLIQAYESVSRSDTLSSSITPSETDYEIQDYRLYAPLAAGSYGVISPCVKVRPSGTSGRSSKADVGKLYAVKRVLRRQGNFRTIKNEIEIMEMVKEHPHVCYLVDVIFTSGDRNTAGRNDIADVYYILSEYAQISLGAMVRSGQHRGPNSTKWFHQAAQALRFLHRDLELVHRDIKLENFLIKEGRLLLTDFGEATRERRSQDYRRGTIAYHPPEILRLREVAEQHQLKKLETSRKGTVQARPAPDELRSCYWSSASDIYQLGLVAFQMYYGLLRWPHEMVDESMHALLLSKIESSQVDDLLRAMLTWNAHDRPSASRALLLPFWPDPETPFNSAKRRYLHG